MSEKWVKRKNRLKVVRTIFEIAVCVAALAWVVLSIRGYRLEQDRGTAMPPESESTMISSDEIVSGYSSVGHASGTHFVAISYNGIVKRPTEGGKIVNLAAFMEQMQALKASGYQTITQQDIVNAYERGGLLPEKALLLIFEDGIFDSALLAQPTLEACNYHATMCTYAGNLSDEQQLYITAENAKQLVDSSYWEMGSNGYRLSYINVFDRYENYFGDLTTAEYLDIHNYLRRDYNHYLMDFLRDENRLRRESEAQMESRISWDYEKARELYLQDLGYVPGLYILMHSNTGAYGNDPLVSRKNEEMMRKVFSMNFNRQGSCLNMLDASLYDLSRLQSRQYFSTNHLMMRIWDDTGHEVKFRLGDASVAAHWKRLCGVAEYSDHRVIVTSMPYGKGAVMCNEGLPEEFTLTVRLQGNVVGQQSIAMRADEHGEGGIVVRLHNNMLYVEDPASVEPVFALNLLVFDGGPFASRAEDELAGKQALCRTIIENDDDGDRVIQAQEELAYLETLRAPSIAEGAEPYIPELDIDEQDDRALRVEVSGSYISVWLDDTLVVDHMKVSDGAGNRLVLGSEITTDNERFSQTNLSDDVYDAVFRDLRITNRLGFEVYAYAEPLPDVVTNVGFVDRIINVFRDWMD